MDFADTAEDAAFRAEWRAWLETHGTPRSGDPQGFGTLVAEGSWGPAELERAEAWQRALADGGWAAIHWPSAHGGRGATPMQAYIFGHELERYDVPVDVYTIGLGMIGPTIIACGTPEQQARYLPPMRDGSEIWCQLWSEPGAGSDVASLRTRAEWEAARGCWVLNGQKVWTSGAHFARWGLAIVRTDPDAPRHKGLSAVIIDMHAPGVEVRPLREMSGGATFNEVFFTDVDVPAENMVGDVNDGWRVALTTLAHERLTAGLLGLGAMSVAPLLALARATQRDGRAASADPLVRDRLADVYIKHRTLTLNIYRMLTAMAKHGVPGPEGSTLKLAWSALASAEAALALDILGIDGTRTGVDAPAAGEWATAYAFAPSYHIAGGTDEIQRTIIGERVLGLPKEPDLAGSRPTSSSRA